MYTQIGINSKKKKKDEAFHQNKLDEQTSVTTDTSE